MTAAMAARGTFALAVLALALSEAGAQDVELPPGVLLLSKIKRHVKDELEHLPAYTCLETVQRSDTNAKGKLEPLDTLRLEILYTGRRELYASPGAEVFGEEGPGAFVSGGMIGDGIFASHLHTIFLSGPAIIKYAGEDTVARERGWASAVKYDFSVSQMQSGWSITLPLGSGLVGERGSFWADPETLDLLRVEIHAADIPPELAISDVQIASSYARMRIGSGDIMLPQTAELRMTESGGREAVDVFEFTHCRSYQAESSISFDTSGAVGAEPTAAAAAPVSGRPARVPGTLPAGLTVPVTLTTALGGDSTVGTLLEGRVAANVDLKGKTLVPEGARVLGRIRRLERHQDAGGYYVVGLEFTDVESGGSSWRFYADLQT
ncbi:MAG TPA: hypothetical protein VGS58_04180, partial [Candidatus Sulfopaludibacter sp.]|nr:hypothetical protein [Candidatus Sulfopaludibacter sp.]